MDAILKMRCSFLVILSLVTLFSQVQADNDSEEFRLLRSWGLQFDVNGELRFQPGKENAQISRWSPDLSAYQVERKSRPEQIKLDPLVFSARNQPQASETIKTK